MLPWILVLLVPLLCGICYKKNVVFFNKKLNLDFIWAFILLFLFRGFRADTVGGDLASYKEAYSIFTDFDIHLLNISASGYESGYVLYNAILNKFSSDFRLEIIITALFTTFGLLKFIYKNSLKPGLSLYIYITMYMYGQSFNNERQAIAIVILMLSIIYIRKRKPFKFIFCVLVATLFHTTSLIFIVLYPLYNIRISAVYWIVSIITAVVVYIMTGSILGYLLGGLYSEKYLSTDLMEGGGYSYFVLLVLLIITAIIIMSKKQLSNPDNRLWIHMMVVAAIMQIISFKMGYFYRAVILFSVSMIFLVPCIIDNIHHKDLAIAAKITIISLLFGYYIYSLSNDSLELLPYKSVLF